MNNPVKKFGKFFKKSMSCETLSFKAVMGILLPVIVDVSLLSLIGIVNSAMVSSSGPGIVSATSLTNTINSMFQCLFIAFATGGSILVSQYKGKGDYKKLKDALGEMYFLTIILSIVISVILVFCGRGLFNLLYGTLDDKTVFENGVLYLFGITLTYPIFAVSQSGLASLRGMGDGKACMTVSISSSVVNIVSNFIFIYGFGLGIYGVMISLALNRISAASLSLFFLKKFHPELGLGPKDFFKHNNEDAKKIAKVSLPFIFEQLFFNGGGLVNSSFLSRCGSLAVEANAIAGSMLIFQQISTGVESGAVPIVGQCVGAGRYKEARRMLNNCIIFATAVTGTVVMCYLPFVKIIMSAFSPSPEAAQIIPRLVIFIGITWTVFGASSCVGASGLRASGDATFTTVGAMFSMWCVKILLGYILAIHLGWGIYGMYIATASEWVSRGILFTARRFSKKWCAHKLV